MSAALLFYMRKSIFLSILLIISGCINDDPENSGADLKIGDSLPDFEVIMNDGAFMSDDSLKGSVSVITFFNTSCPDCRRTLPHMQRIYSDYIEKGVVFAFISREETEKDISKYWSENHYDMPYSAQKGRKIYELFASERIPRVYISDEEGIIRCIFTDDPTPEYDDVKNIIDSLL